MDTVHGDGHSARVYNLGSGRLDPLRTLLEGIVSELNLDVKLRFAAKPFRQFEPMHLVADTHRAESELGWIPRHNLAHAIWELATESFPGLKVRQPRESI